MAHPDRIRIEAAKKFKAARDKGERGAITAVEAETGFARNTLARWLEQFKNELKTPGSSSTAISEG